ncbi:hypothetical protein PMAYCL1PPCAC_31092, partial [Pristionchus mayeri]
LLLLLLLRFHWAVDPSTPRTPPAPLSLPSCPVGGTRREIRERVPPRRAPVYLSLSVFLLRPRVRD